MSFSDQKRHSTHLHVLVLKSDGLKKTSNKLIIDKKSITFKRQVKINSLGNCRDKKKAKEVVAKNRNILKYF